jgi:hypothetical protein
MRDVTLKTKVCGIGELHGDIREKVLERYRNINVGDSYWYESTYEHWKEKLEALGYREPEIQFSGFWSQGDGASFTCKEIDLRTWIKAHKAGNRYRALISHLDCVSGQIKRGEYRYVHYNTIFAELEITEHHSGKAESQLLELEWAVKNDAQELSQQIYRELEADYEAETSDEAIEDTLAGNAYEFFENGDDYNLNHLEEEESET